MQELRLEEGCSLLDPVHLFDIDKRQHLDRRSADRSRIYLPVQPYVEDDLTDPSVKTSFKCIEKAVVDPALKLFEDVK